MSNNAHVLHARVRALAAELEIRGGQLALPLDALPRWLEVFERTAHRDKKRLATDLVALAFKLRRLEPAASKEAVVQLSVLAATVLGEAGLARMGLDPDRFRREDAKRLLGSESVRAADASTIGTHPALGLLEARASTIAKGSKRSSKRSRARERRRNEK